MKYIGSYISTLFALFLLQVSPAVALELIDATIPVSLRAAYNARYTAPLTCIEKTKQYINQRKYVELHYWPLSGGKKHKKEFNAFPTQLQAFCYTQIEDYATALNLLLPLLEKNNLSNEHIRSLNLIALTIPEEDRAQLNNISVLKKIYDSAMQNQSLAGSPHFSIVQLFAISKLSLQTNQYQNAFNALEEIKKRIKGNNAVKLHAWLVYYYGVYYKQINQQQLASFSFLQANTLADKFAFIGLSGQAKKSLVDMYQKKYRFPIAFDFAEQRIALYLNTENKIKQADSLIQLALLKREQNDNNQSLIYLFNALELVRNNKNSDLLARVQLEIGRTYLANSKNKKNSKELPLAQKYLQNARFHFSRMHKTRQQIESLLLLAQLNISNSDSALSILQLQEVLQLSANNYFPLRVQAFEMLALIYEVTGDLQQAILHFKNFHELQNRIKQHVLELQQLQISEQLQLFENTQQQEQLKIKNTQLEKANARLKTLTYSSMSLLMLVIILFSYTLIRNKKLRKRNKFAQQQLAFHSRTKLPLLHANNDYLNSIYTGVPLYYALVNIPFLSQLNELVGSYEGAKIEDKLGLALKLYFTDSVDIFQTRDNQILFISKQQAHQNARTLAQKTEGFFTSFSEKHQLENRISCGIVAFPFLTNAGRAINANRIVELSNLALFAATQIRQSKQQSSWVELYAIDNLQPAFLDGDLWRLGQSAIDKGIVKTNSSHSEFIFDWPALVK